MNKRFLITTSLQNTWRNDVPVLFLGEWCRRFSQKEQWEDMDAEVLPYHWDNRVELHSDYLYLQDFNEELLYELSGKLNQIHGTKHSVRYWRILIGPWLGYFVQILFDRWSSIQDALDNFMISGTIVLNYDKDLFVPDNMKDFIRLIYREAWNHNIYSNIIKKYTNIPCKTISNVQEFENLRIVHTPSFRNRVKQSFIAFCDKIASFFSRDTDAFLLNTYLSFINETRLHLSMKQIPRRIPEVPTITTSVDQSKRKWKLIGKKNQTEFESCVRNLIPQHIPTLYLEGFANLRSKVNNLSWPHKPKVIFTSSSYSTDDLFKLYAAEKTEKGIPLVIGQHGGGIGTHLWAFYEEHQLAICDSFLSWGWTDASEPKVKSIGQLKTKTPLGVQHSKKNGLMLVMVKLPVQSYHLFSAPIAGQWLDYFNDQCIFVDNLSDKIRERMTLRLKSDDLGWEPASRLKDRYPDIAIDEGNFNINNLIKKSRIYVSTYNATSFLEAFTMNIPTIMFWNPNHWELKDAAIPYFNMLREVGILYDSPEKAAKHVNSIWDNVDLWWESDILQSTLNFFKKEYCHIPNDNIVKNINFELNKIALNSKYVKNV